MGKATDLLREELPECADCIESHPFLPGLFALATYQVDQQEVNRELGIDDSDVDAEDGAHNASSSSPAYTRRGLTRLYEVNPQNDKSVASRILSETSMPAVLDAKWTLAAAGQESRHGLLGVADATGHLTMHGLEAAERRSGSDFWRLRQIADLPLNPRQALALSLDWSDRLHHYPSHLAANQSSQVSDAALIASQSDGSLVYLPSIEAAITGDEAKVSARQTHQEDEDDIQDDDDNDDDDGTAVGASPSQQWEAKPVGLESWHAHDHEAWIAAFDAFSNGQVAWSGSDDLTMKGWDMRTPIRSNGQRQPTFVNRRDFDGGITTMQSHWSKEGLWAVGSYDSKLRLFDARNPLRPVSSLELPGGIWRLKWHPTNPSLLLAGCMHGGFAVVDVAGGRASVVEEGLSRDFGQDPEIVTTFEGHGSLAYGCDWDRGDSEREASEQSSSMVYSCSFYDKLLCAWRG